MTVLNLKEILHITGGSIKADYDPSQSFQKISVIENATKDSLSFLHNIKYQQFLYETEAGAVLVSNDFVPVNDKHPLLIYVDDVY